MSHMLSSRDPVSSRGEHIADVDLNVICVHTVIRTMSRGNTAVTALLFSSNSHG
jgi:hypothetical protein